jgi:hypothetical protein
MPPNGTAPRWNARWGSLDYRGNFSSAGRIWFRKNFSTPAYDDCNPRNFRNPSALFVQLKFKEADMGFGKGALLWLIGIPLPIILLLALFMHH